MMKPGMPPMEEEDDESEALGGLMAADAAEMPPAEGEPPAGGDPEMLVSELQQKLAELKAALSGM